MSTPIMTLGVNFTEQDPDTQEFLLINKDFLNNLGLSQFSWMPSTPITAAGTSALSLASTPILFIYVKNQGTGLVGVTLTPEVTIGVPASINMGVIASQGLFTYYSASAGNGVVPGGVFPATWTSGFASMVLYGNSMVDIFLGG